MTWNKRFIFLTVGIVLFFVCGFFVNKDDVSAKAQFSSIYDCVKRAYEAGGQTLEGHDIEATTDKNGMRTVSSAAVDSIVTACKSCYGSDKDWQSGSTISATWFTGENSSFGAYTDGVSYTGKVTKGTKIDIYLWTAGTTCELTSTDAEGLDKHFLNAQDEKNGDGRCPAGTTLINTDGKTWHSNGVIELPNCDNDGYLKNGGNVSRSDGRNFSNRAVSSNGYIRGDNNSFNRKDIGYLSDNSYRVDSWLGTGGLPVNDRYVWAGVGSPITYQLDIGDFVDYVENGVSRGDSTVNVTVNKYDTVKTYKSNNVYIFGCVKHAYPGMVSGVWSAGCKTTKTQIKITVKRPSLIIKAVNMNGESLSGIISDKKCNGNYGTDARIEDVACNAKSGSPYYFTGFKRAATGSYLAKDDIINNQVIDSIDINNRSIRIRQMINDVTVYAVYDDISFGGRARAVEGSNFDNIDNKKHNDTATTGQLYFDTNKTAAPNPLEIECANSGCDVGFVLSLKKLKGGSSAKSNFVVEHKTNNGKWSKVDVGRTAISGDSVYDVLKKTVQLKPGQTECYRVIFDKNGNGNKATASTCVKAKVTYFQASSSVVGVKNYDTNAEYDTSDREKYEWERVDWGEDGKTKTMFFNCPATGCKVRFLHRISLRMANSGSELKSDDVIPSYGSADYRISRLGINCDKGNFSECDNLYLDTRTGNTGIFTENDFHTPRYRKKYFLGINGVSETNKHYTILKPGMIVCERLEYTSANNLNGSYNKTTTICASATGEANTSLDIKVRKRIFEIQSNKLANNWGSYESEVYAKPSDVVQFRSSYNPELQYTYYLKPQRMKINSGNIYPDSGRNTVSTLGGMYNTYKNSDSNSGKGLNNWRNRYSVVGTKFTEKLNYTSYAAGDTTYRENVNPKTGSYPIVGSYVGRSDLRERALTNDNDSTTTTPGKVTFKVNNTNNPSNVVSYVNTNQIKSEFAYVRVPYNFINTTEITKSDDSIYAGETASFEFSVTVNPKTNSYTTNNRDEKYATIVREPKFKIVISYNGQDIESKEVTRTSLNGGYNLNGTTKSGFNISVNIPDVDAGTEICARSAVYPETSGADNNYLDKKGNDRWAYSARKCYKVAKRPSLQVWGGSIYSTGKINITPTIKNNLHGYKNYNISESETNFVFGSWGELSVVGTGVIKGLASGAATGYKLNNNGTLWPNQKPNNGNGNVGNRLLASNGPGGSEEKSLKFCLRSQLSISNEKCNSGKVGEFGGSNVNVLKSSKQSLIDRFMKDGTAAEYKHFSGDYEIESIYYNTKKKTTRVIHARNITIKNNLTYEDGYESLADIPKLIIYAEENIRISCDVDRIDAVLIAENDVNTCSDSNSIKNEKNSRQLVINGTIIADTLTANRTYGAAKGANSIVPAEIINYDTTLYLWGSNGGDTASGSGRINTVYTRDVAPRY